MAAPFIVHCTKHQLSFVILAFCIVLSSRTAGCARTSTVPVATASEASLDAPKTDLPHGKKKSWTWEDPSPGRIIASQTAFTQKKGTFDFQFSTLFIPFISPVVFNFFDATYGILENLELRIGTIIPIQYVGAGVFPKFSIPLGRYVRIGYMIDFSVFKRYSISKEDCSNENNVDICQPQLVYGGSPLILTIGGKNHNINLSLHVIDYRGNSEECEFDIEGDICTEYLHNQIMVIASVGVSFRVAKWVKLAFEFWYVNKHDITLPTETYAQSHYFWPMIGLKIIGRTFHGELSIIQYCYTAYPYCLSNFSPMLVFGFTYPM
jgi:hypothetical protein